MVTDTAGETVAYGTLFVTGGPAGGWPGGVVGLATTVLVAAFAPAVLPTAFSVTVTFVLPPAVSVPRLFHVNAPSVFVVGLGLADTNCR